MQMLKNIRFEISQNGKMIYQGTLDSQPLTTARSLGKFKPGQKGKLDFQLEIPKKWDNTYALKKTDVTWTFAVKENEKPESMSPDKKYDSECSDREGQSKENQAQKKKPVKTGDDSEPILLFLLLWGSGAIVLSIRIYKGGKES